MTIQKLSIQNLLLVGFTLFSMFFGAGNLIFPPDLAARAGAQVIPAMAGFLISAVGLPVLGVAAVAVSGGLEKLAGKVGGRFSLLFTLTAYLAIGPFLAIPRTASTSFEMTLLPVLSGAGVQLGDYLGHTGMTVRFWAQLGYSFVFFAIALLLSVHPETLSERLGKVTCPALLILIAVLFTGRLIWPMEGMGETAAEFAAGASVRGFMEGYQTMDTLAALNFGIIISLNIRNKGISREDSVIRDPFISGLWCFGLYWRPCRTAGGSRHQRGQNPDLCGRRSFWHFGNGDFGDYLFYRLPEYLCGTDLLLQPVFFYSGARRWISDMDGGFCGYQPFDFQRGTGSYFEIFRSCFKCRLSNRDCSHCSGFYGAVYRAQDLGVPSVDPVYGGGKRCLDHGSGSSCDSGHNGRYEASSRLCSWSWMAAAGCDWRAAWKDDSRRK